MFVNSLILIHNSDYKPHYDSDSDGGYYSDEVDYDSDLYNGNEQFRGMTANKIQFKNTGQSCIHKVQQLHAAMDYRYTPSNLVRLSLIYN